MQTWYFVDGTSTTERPEIDWTETDVEANAAYDATHPSN